MELDEAEERLEEQTFDELVFFGSHVSLEKKQMIMNFYFQKGYSRQLVNVLICSNSFKIEFSYNPIFITLIEMTTCPGYSCV